MRKPRSAGAASAGASTPGRSSRSAWSSERCCSRARPSSTASSTHRAQRDSAVENGSCLDQKRSHEGGEEAQLVARKAPQEGSGPERTNTPPELTPVLV